jgi:hypothetical protein
MTGLGDAVRATVSATRDDETAAAVEAVHQGYELHYGDAGPGDPDLALLDGDRLYALGLHGLARRGDLAAVAALADVIAHCAEAHATDRPQDAAAAWEAGAAAIAGGA